MGWTLNDYQIDVSKPEGRTEYERIIDMTSDLGVQTLIYGPANNEISRMADDTDDWHWEHILWLGLGQKIRQGKWDAETSPIPASVSEMLDYGKTRNVSNFSPMSTLPFRSRRTKPGWSPIRKRKPRTYMPRWPHDKFQDFLVHQLLVFKRAPALRVIPLTTHF